MTMSVREDIKRKWKREKGIEHFVEEIISVYSWERITEWEFHFLHRIDLHIQFDFYIVFPITINIVISYSIRSGGLSSNIILSQPSTRSPTSKFPFVSLSNPSPIRSHNTVLSPENSRSTLVEIWVRGRAENSSELELQGYAFH